MNNINFNDLHWHDSVIKSISIDRTDPGIDDNIIFDIDWSNSINSFLKFTDVYWASMNLNFGIIAEESIYYAEKLGNDDEDLIQFYKGWKSLMDDVELQVFQIELNSTGSKIKIIAKNFEIIDK